MPLLDTEGHTRMIRASGVVSTARIKTGRKSRRAYGSLSDVEREAARSAWEWECADMVIGRDDMDCKPEHICGWRGWPEEGLPLEVTGSSGFYIRKGPKTQRKELGGSRALTGSQQGKVSHPWCEHFY